MNPLAGVMGLEPLVLSPVAISWSMCERKPMVSGERLELSWGMLYGYHSRLEHELTCPPI